jgi:spore photoproduct lyase
LAYGNPSKYIRRIYVDSECSEEAYTREIIQRSGLPATVIGQGEVPVIAGEYPENLNIGKQALFLCRNKGRFFKTCPATREYNCCDYHVLNIGMNCPMDCVYCILQAYLNNPWLSFFVNLEDLFCELDEILTTEKNRFFRIGTGEFTDSLALDNLTGLSRYLVQYISQSSNAVLELKTKSAVIQNLKELDHNNRVVIGWSLNSPAIMASEEIRTASLDERLAAADRCASWGYKLAFHFDPIIYHHNWQIGYRQTIRKLFEKVPAENIVWISMGGLRYLPSLKTIATDRFPKSRFFYEEFINGLDGKSRYFRSLRVEMYKLIADELAKYVDKKTCVYFCMESDAIWKEVFGFTPGERGGLPMMLDCSMR